VGDPAPKVAKFTRYQYIDNSGLDRQRCQGPATDWLRSLIPGISPVVPKVYSAFFVENVVYRAGRDQDYHDDNVCLHDSG
jgi:hypothetical protein